MLYGVLDDASHHLLNELPANPVFAQLRDDVKRLRATSRRRRLGLLSGFLRDDLEPEDRWKQIESLFPGDLSGQIGDAIFGAEADELVIKSASQAALMFGSLSPSIDIADARTLAEKLVQFYDSTGESSNLSRLVKDVPVEGSDERAWKQGYQLAESLLEAVDGATAREAPIAIEGLLDHFGITVQRIALHDQSVRAVAMAGPEHKPAVLVNDNVLYSTPQTRRFTLAHELCHILHDRNYGARLALASGPWAPVDVEKRANAFAAMLLMPADLVGDVVRTLPFSLDSPDAIWAVANAFQTSFAATLDHLWNLGHIDEATRDALRAASEVKTGFGKRVATGLTSLTAARWGYSYNMIEQWVIDRLNPLNTQRLIILADPQRMIRAGARAVDGWAKENGCTVLFCSGNLALREMYEGREHRHPSDAPAREVLSPL